MKKYVTISGREVNENQIIETFVNQDWHIAGELERMEAQIERLTQLLSNVSTQTTLDYAIQDLSLKEVKY